MTRVGRIIDCSSRVAFVGPLRTFWGTSSRSLIFPRSGWALGANRLACRYVRRTSRAQPRAARVRALDFAWGLRAARRLQRGVSQPHLSALLEHCRDRASTEIALEMRSTDAPLPPSTRRALGPSSRVRPTTQTRRSACSPSPARSSSLGSDRRIRRWLPRRRRG